MKLLLVHTGGTIGMVETRNGLAPKEGLVEAALALRLPQGVKLASHVFRPLLDSADMGPSDWNEILAAIHAEPDAAVIVTHGTDTMAYTGAALSQALAGLGRRIILCGAMTPLNMGGDAEANLDLAIQAALAGGEGVFLAFNQEILPAAGLVKHDSGAAAAFRATPQNLPAKPARRRFVPQRLAILTLSPCLPAAALKAMLAELDGAVLRAYGSGTMMNKPDLIAVIGDAVKQGKRLRLVSQCETGGLHPGTYAAGQGLWATGAENGGLETPEAALIHLWLN